MVMFDIMFKGLNYQGYYCMSSKGDYAEVQWRVYADNPVEVSVVVSAESVQMSRAFWAAIFK